MRDFKAARINAKHQRNHYRRIEKKNKARLNRHKADFNKSKDKYSYQKQKYKSSGKSKAQKLRLKLEKKDYKFAKKQYKSYKRGTKRLERKIHRSHTTLQRPVPIVLKPIGYAGKSGFSAARNKAESADETNDVLRGGIKAYDVTKTGIRGTHSAARAVDSKYQNHLKKSISKGNEKLKLQHDRLSKGNVKRPESAYSQFRKRWKRANRNSNGSVKDAIKDFAKETVSAVGAAVKDIAVKLIGCMLPAMVPIVCFMLIIAIIFGFFTVFEDSGFILGTYAARDNELSDAEEYYTFLASDFNENILNCGNSGKWKKGLKALTHSSDISSYKVTPTYYYFGVSKEFSYEPADYDFDVYVLWSFLCAYYYDFEASAEAHDSGESYDPPYWTFDEDGEDILKKLFDEEYTFEYVYSDNSSWSGIQGGAYAIQISPDNGNYWVVDSTTVTKYSDGTAGFKYKSAPSEITAFAKDGWIRIDEDSREVLDANNGYTSTGWYVQDQTEGLVTLSTNVGSFYKWTGSKYIWSTDSSRERSGFSWSSGNDILWLVSPADTVIWNSSLTDSCLIRYYQKYVWSEAATLYYNVKQNCTFDEAARNILKTLDYSSERLEYYDLQLNGSIDTSAGTSVSLPGNHQSIISPVSDSLDSLISDGRIIHDFGYDVDEWNSVHCEIGSDTHRCIDISCSVGENVYAVIDGKITSIDTSNHSVQITSSIDLWYDDEWYTGERDIRITYTNVDVSGLSKGDMVTQGDIIGKVTDSRLCGTVSNPNIGTYIHFQVELDYWSGYHSIDPRLLIK